MEGFRTLRRRIAKFYLYLYTSGVGGVKSGGGGGDAILSLSNSKFEASPSDSFNFVKTERDEKSQFFSPAAMAAACGIRPWPSKLEMTNSNEKVTEGCGRRAFIVYLIWRKGSLSFLFRPTKKVDETLK